MSEKKPRNYALDALKGLACIGVMVIHYNFPEQAGAAMKAFSRFAVAIFLAISGYFYMQRDEQKQDGYLMRQLRSQSRLLVKAGLFYLIFSLIYYPLSTKGWDAAAFAAEKITAGKIVKLFVTNDPFVFSHLWYILGMVWCYLFLCVSRIDRLFRKRFGMWLALLLAAGLLVRYSTLQEFKDVLHISAGVKIPGTDDWLMKFNLFIYRVLPFFLFGAVIRHWQDKLAALPLKNWMLWGLFILGGVISAIEDRHFVVSQFYLGTYVQFFALMVWALKNPQGIKPLNYVGKNLSLHVYVFHIAVGRVVSLIMGKLHFWGTPVSSYGTPVCTWILTLLLAWGIAVLSAKGKALLAARRAQA